MNWIKHAQTHYENIRTSHLVAEQTFSSNKIVSALLCMLVCVYVQHRLYGCMFVCVFWCLYVKIFCSNENGKYATYYTFKWSHCYICALVCRESISASSSPSKAKKAKGGIEREYGKREECTKATLITKPFRCFVKQHRPYNIYCSESEKVTEKESRWICSRYCRGIVRLIEYY